MFVTLLLLISIGAYTEAGAAAAALGYGAPLAGYGGYGYGYGNLAAAPAAYYSGGYGYGNGYGNGYNKYGPIPAAITSRRNVEIRPVALPQDPISPTVLEVAPLELPVQIVYNSKSSPVQVHQNHIPGAPGQVERTSSQEEPHVVVHEVVRPVIQELREVITPYRRVVQEIKPVVETVNTIVAKGERAQVVGIKSAPVAIAAPVAVPAVGLVGAALPVGGYTATALAGSQLLAAYRAKSS